MNIDGKDSVIILLIIQTKRITINFITCLYSATGFGHSSCSFSSKYTANQQPHYLKNSVTEYKQVMKFIVILLVWIIRRIIIWNNQTWPNMKLKKKTLYKNVFQYIFYSSLFLSIYSLINNYFCRYICIILCWDFVIV